MDMTTEAGMDHPCWRDGGWRSLPDASRHPTTWFLRMVLSSPVSNATPLTEGKDR